MLTRSYWKNYGDFLLELVDTYADDIAFKLARLVDSDSEFLQVKKFMGRLFNSFNRKSKNRIYYEYINGFRNPR